LAKRGEGRFCDDVLTTKIPPNLPFPKGGISDIFMLFLDQRFMSEADQKPLKYYVRHGFKE
jgi:hypothetical protein